MRGRLAVAEREHGGAVPAGVGDHLFEADDLLSGGAGGQEVLGLVVVLDGLLAVVSSLVAEVRLRGADMQLGELLAQRRDVVVHEPPRRAKAVFWSQLILAPAAPESDHARSMPRWRRTE